MAHANTHNSRWAEFSMDTGMAETYGPYTGNK